MAYVPDRGDAIWLNFNPQAGHVSKPGIGLRLCFRRNHITSRPAWRFFVPPRVR